MYELHSYFQPVSISLHRLQNIIRSVQECVKSTSEPAQKHYTKFFKSRFDQGCDHDISLAITAHKVTMDSNVSRKTYFWKQNKKSLLRKKKQARQLAEHDRLIQTIKDNTILSCFVSSVSTSPRSIMGNQIHEKWILAIIPSQGFQQSLIFFLNSTQFPNHS